MEAAKAASATTDQGRTTPPNSVGWANGSWWVRTKRDSSTPPKIKARVNWQRRTQKSQLTLTNWPNASTERNGGTRVGKWMYCKIMDSDTVKTLLTVELSIVWSCVLSSVSWLSRIGRMRAPEETAVRELYAYDPFQSGEENHRQLIATKKTVKWLAFFPITYLLPPTGTSNGTPDFQRLLLKLMSASCGRKRFLVTKTQLQLFVV